MRIHVFFLVLAAWIASVSMASAQDAAMIQTARKEGTVAWYTSLAIPSSTSIAQAFKTKYTGIDVEVHRTGSQRVLQRVMQEASSGIKNADVIHTSDADTLCCSGIRDCCCNILPKASKTFRRGSKTRMAFILACAPHSPLSLIIQRLCWKRTRRIVGRIY